MELTVGEGGVKKLKICQHLAKIRQKNFRCEKY